jgi:hypothetical protein
MKLNHIFDDDPSLPTVLAHHRSCVRQLPETEALEIDRRVFGLQARNCGCVPSGVFPSARVLNDYDSWRGDQDPGVVSEGPRRVRKWLFECGVPFAQEVVVGDYEGEVVATTWKVFVRYWQHFLWSKNGADFYVTDRSMSWMLGCCHHDILTFGRRWSKRSR